MDDAWRAKAASAVADAFGLGPVLGDLEPIGGGRSHLMWQLQTTAGLWAVKQLNRSREPWWMNDYRIAAQVEQAAWGCGVAMPRPLQPVNPAAPLLADVTVDEAVVSFRVHQWCEGQVLDGIGSEVLRTLLSIAIRSHLCSIADCFRGRVAGQLRGPAYWGHVLGRGPVAGAVSCPA